MNIPRFSAEASLYKTNQHYQLFASWAGTTEVYVGLAQPGTRPPPDGDGGQSCRPRSLGCLPDDSSPTGCRIFFQQADCTEVALAPCQCPGPPPPPPNCGTGLFCGNHCCPPGGSGRPRPCANNGCCPEFTHVCTDDQTSCCADGASCGSFFGQHFCYSVSTDGEVRITGRATPELP